MINFNQNYFQLFKIEQSVTVDSNSLEKKYFELQAVSANQLIF
jgi:hypothetical protein